MSAEGPQDSAPPPEHGGPRTDELRALGIDPAALVDFSVNVNPYGPCPAVRRAILDAPVDCYPDPAALAARRTLGSVCGVSADRVVLGSGAADLLWTIARVLVGPGERALIVEPTFSELRRALAAAGARVFEWRARPESGFRVDVDAVAAILVRERPRLAYVCTPCSPTGSAVALADLVALAAAAPDTRLVVDESFASLSDRFAEAEAPLPESVIRVRSLTKDHAIPGVRVGYLIAPPDVASRMEIGRAAWPTSAAAQAAAIAACDQTSFIADSRRRLADDRANLSASLRALGLEPLPSVAPFLLVAVGDAGDLRARLLARHQILIRDCASFGLPGFARLSARPPRDVARLVAALREEIR